MLHVLIAALAHAADGASVAAGFAHVRDTGGCAIAMRPETDPAGAAMRADCEWPEIDPATLTAMLGAYARYPSWVFPITVARVARTEGDRTLVYQRQHVFGLSDREVLLWMHQEVRADGVRVSWTTADEEPLALAPGSIRTPKNVGYWDVAVRPGGGVRVVHEVAVDAGGAVPRWIVNVVRTRAFAKILADVRAAAAAGAGG